MPASGIAYVSVAVADMQPVRDLWIDQFGMDIVARREGPDPDLAQSWGIDANRIVEQLLLETPGAATGRLHFVEISNPGSAIRADAEPYDLGAKNIDVNCTDLPGIMARLKAAGYSFRSDIVEYNIEGIHVREVQMPAHDGLNIAFIEVLSEGFETPYTDKGCAAVTSFVVSVEDTVSEAEFYKSVFGFEEIMYHQLSGPDIETAIGLPQGAAVHMRLCGNTDNMFGRMELINYEGLNGTNRFATARPPAAGILYCGFVVESMDSFVAAAAAQNIAMTEPKQIDAIYGAGRIASLASPAGLRIEVLEPA